MRRLLLLFALLATAASAQPGWRAVPAGGPVVSVDLLYAFGDDIEVTSATGEETAQALGVLSTSVLVGARVPVTGRITLVGELPLGYITYDYTDLDLPPGVPVPEDTDGAALGNPYLGVEVAVGPELAVGGGVRLPFVEEGDFRAPQGWQAGMATEIERFEAYFPDLLAASAAVAFTPALSERVRARLRLEPTLLVPFEEEGTENGADLALGVGAALDARVGAATLSGGGLGRRILTSGRYDLDGLFDADAVATLGLAVEVGGVRPGLDLRVPLYDTALGQDATLAVRVDVPLR